MAVLSRRSGAAATRRHNRDAIVAATITLLEDATPFAELSIEQIVRQAGLSRPTFYTYFRDKRALVLHLGEVLTADLAAAADPWLEKADGDPRDTLAAVHAVFRRHAPTLRAITEAATYDADVAEFWRAFHDRFVPGAERRIRAGHPDLDDAAIAARAFALVWMTERTLTENLVRPTVDATALVDQLAWIWSAAAGAAASG